MGERCDKYGKYWVRKHCEDRYRDRRISQRDVRNAIASASHCAAYEDGTPETGGTCWRIEGPTLDEEDLAVGVEAYLDILQANHRGHGFLREQHGPHGFTPKLL
jgi:hypothetical protein